MTIRTQVPLRELTTLKVGGNAAYVCECESIADVAAAVALAREQNLPLRVLGEGSNVLARDEGYPGVILRMAIPGITYREEFEGTYVTAGAGVCWDDLVRDVAARGLWGMENLAGIPGTVGAAPVQNIGAYGAEIAPLFVSASVYNMDDGEVHVYRAEDCAFGYRDSIFKHERNLLICSVTFILSPTPAPRLGYSDVAQLVSDGADMSTPQTIGENIRQVRARKFPDLRTHGTAGSFFKNPILTHEQFSALNERYGALPSFAAANGVKVPLAFILDRVLHLKGYAKGNVSLFGNQPLVLVVEQGATAHEVDVFAREIEEKVFAETKISIEREVQTL